MLGRLITRAFSKAVPKPAVECLFHEETGTCCYIVVCNETGSAAVIDSVLDYDSINHRTSTTHAEKVISKLRSSNLALTHIFETHIHADHLTASNVLKKAFPAAKSAIGSNVTKVQETFAKLLNLQGVSLTGSEFDILLKHNDQLTIGNLPFRAISTPGHTPACMAYVIGDSVFTGDTIFMPDFGTSRCDFPGGSAELLYESILKLFELPEDFRLFVGHDYGTDIRKPAWETTVKEEKNNNKQLNLKTPKEDFVAWRKGRDSKLSLPKLIMQSLQVNLRNGKLPDPENNGTVYFKVPVNLL